MKIAIDAFNLGLHQGTGIATYGRELADLLGKSGNDIFPIYGLDNLSIDKNLSYAKFIQKLGVEGQSSKKDFLLWGAKFVLGMPSHILGIPFDANYIEKNEHISLGSVKEKLPFSKNILNTSSIYRISQAYSFFSKKVTKIRLPIDVDIFHLTSPLPISISKVPKIVTVHDIIPIVLPASTEVNLTHYRSMINASLKDADLIFTVSEFSKNDLMKFFNIQENRIHVTYQSVNIPNKYKNFTKSEVSSFLENTHKLNFGEYFLYYGAIEPKKNVARIIESFTRSKTDFPIVIVGKNGWLFNDVDNLLQSLHQNESGRRRFRRIPYSSFQNLMLLLKGARGFIFPSLYEGFGLPVLEAMQMGCPVITSNTSSLPEVGGNAVHYVDPYDTDSIVSAVDRFSSDNDYLYNLIQAGYIQSEKFSQSAHLKLLLQGYEAVLNKKN
jgi:glycosyltransferase involved in cell wall biosynthesis